ncbi:SDR family oxidoreductase [Pacificimonas sp. WHA3]|uniref:SDR family oxidoreductase n=1 Tax=Pacificimonas pallii TaxID=2827236 RepID=A0ABS6SD53_9SPHN|nr:SDR family oxidoreductase [Pacificimonas pallii]MBV7256347.1 SDR family oxidoreductase [Pacificimonas pallii]
MKLALVTGGTQRLGAAIAAELAAHGWALALHYRSAPEPTPELAQAVAKASIRSATFPADLSEEGSESKLIADVTAHFETPPTLLINNASLFGADRLDNTGIDDLMRHYRVNTAAPTMLAKAFVAQLRMSGDRGAIVNMLDQRLAQPHGDNLAYTMSKFALAGLTEILARTLAPDVRVNSVAPGLTIPTSAYNDAALQRARAAMPLARLPQPEEIARAVAFLAESESITGESIAVDGGARHVSFGRDFNAI